MIAFSCRRHHPQDGTPLVSALQLQSYAERVLADYCPALLQRAGRICPEHFIEHYLGARLLYLDLYYPEGGAPIAGATVFDPAEVPIFDREALCITRQSVPAGSILIDNATLRPGREGFCLFTHLHEAGHFLLHGCVRRPAAPALLCRSEGILGRHPLRSQADFRELQANTFAAALAMPRPTLVPLVRERMRRLGRRGPVWLQGTDFDWDFDPALEELLCELSALYGVSRTAARVQLRRQGLLTDRYQQAAKTAVQC